MSKSVLVMVIQTNRTMFVYINLDIDIYYKESDHKIDYRVQILQYGPVGWRPREADGADEVEQQSAGEYPLVQSNRLSLFHSGLQLVG